MWNYFNHNGIYCIVSVGTLPQQVEYRKLNVSYASVNVKKENN